jgi:hypothetical protein
VNPPLHRDALLHIVSDGNVLYALWHDAPTVPHLRALGRALRIMVKAHPDGYLLLNTVHAGTPNFKEDVRKEVFGLLADRSIAPRATAHVILVGGFAAAATRAFIGALLLAARPPSPTKIFGEMGDAVTWLEKHGANIPGTPDAQTIRATHDAIAAAPVG